MTTRGGGREIKAVIDGPGSNSGLQDKAIIKFGGRTPTIEVQGEELKVTADGAIIFSGALPR